MADNQNTITTVFKADISNFSKSTQDLNRYISTVNAEFKNAVAGLDKWDKTQTGLQAKITQLNKTLEAEEQKLDNLESAYAEMVAAGKENTREAQQLANAINNQAAKVKETEKNIGKYTDSLNELQEAGVDTREELEKLTKKQEELNKAQEDFEARAGELGGNVLPAMGVGLAGVATACVGALAGLASLVDETKELRKQMGQLETSFEVAGLGADNAKKTFKTLYGVLGDEGKATEASLHLAQLAKDEKELVEYTDILTGVYARYGDTLPVEGLAEAMNHTAELGSVQGVLADAIEWSGGNVDAFNKKLEKLNSEEERAQLIKETLNGIFGESAEKYKEVNADVTAANEAQAEYNATMAEIAEKVQPAVTDFKLAMVDILQTVFDKFSETDIDGLISNIGDVITDVTTNVLPPLMEVITWVIDNLDILLPIFGALTAGIIAQNAATQIKTVTDLAAAQGVSVLTLAQKGLNAALKANPIGLVITAVGLLITVFVTLWNKCEGFRNFFIGMWEKIKELGSEIADFLGGLFSGIMGFYKGYINGIIGLINSAIGLLNKIKIPDWEIFGDLAGKGLNIPTIPLLAKGGIVDRATLAMIGEQGKEAVVPLENNTGWIDELAQKLNKAGGSGPRVVNVNQTFEKMETSQYALHKAKIEMLNALKLAEA